ncbi:MAG: SocA family protein [Bacteroidales bacterium]|nr:SocA family protein [Bacteroidales bacterium]
MNLQQFNLNKSLQAVLYVANRLVRKDFHKIFKVLYFADRNHLSKYGRSITGDTYIAMTDGPVPSNIYDIFKSVRGDGFFSKRAADFTTLFRVVDWNFIFPEAEADISQLSESDVEELDDSLRLYGSLSWDEVREKSHDYAWRSTARDYPISVENMIMETGDSKEYAEYVASLISAQSQLPL